MPGLSSFKIASALGGLLYLLGFFCISITPPAESYERMSQSFVNYSSPRGQQHDRIIHDQMMFFDTEPLFLPTSWNYASRVIEHVLEDYEAPLFEAFPAALTLDIQALEPSTEKPDQAITSPLDTLKLTFWDHFSTFGMEARLAPSLAPRSGYLEIVDLDSGQKVRSEQLSRKLMEWSDQPLWSPIEFLVVIDQAGPVGSPLLQKGTGSDDIDNTLKNLITQPFFLADLAPGYYKLTIGP